MYTYMLFSILLSRVRSTQIVSTLRLRRLHSQVPFAIDWPHDLAAAVCACCCPTQRYRAPASLW